MLKEKQFAIAVNQPYAESHRFVVKSTGEFRNPQKGEWHISGAIPEGYRATQSLSTPYWIAKLVKK